jgi:hypothetical protein
LKIHDVPEYQGDKENTHTYIHPSPPFDIIKKKGKMGKIKKMFKIGLYQNK